MRWEFPLFKPDDKLDPTKLKKPGGRKKEHTADELLEFLSMAPLSNKAWQAQALEHGIGQRNYYTLRNELVTGGRVRFNESSKTWEQVPKLIPNEL